MTLTAEDNLTAILQNFRGDPQEASALAEFLGFEPLPNPQDQLAGPLTAGLRQFFRQRDDKFRVHQLFRVGRQKAQPADVGLFVGVLSDWGSRSSDRDRPRRRIARALVEQVPERRSGNIFVERLWPTVKYEEVYLKAYVNAVEARRELGAYFRFYNKLRPHQALGYQTPAEVFHGEQEVQEVGE